MLIQESELRYLIRKELIKESYRSNYHLRSNYSLNQYEEVLLNEISMQDFKQGLSKVSDGIKKTAKKLGKIAGGAVAGLTLISCMQGAGGDPLEGVRIAEKAGVTDEVGKIFQKYLPDITPQTMYEVDPNTTIRGNNELNTDELIEEKYEEIQQGCDRMANELPKMLDNNEISSAAYYSIVISCGEGLRKKFPTSKQDLEAAFVGRFDDLSRH